MGSRRTTSAALPRPSASGAGDPSRAGISFPWTPAEWPRAKRKRGNANAGAPFPCAMTILDNLTRKLLCGGKARPGIRKWLSILHFARFHWAALYAARVVVRAGVSVTVGDKRGVSDPHFAAPFFAPWSGWKGVAHAPDACHVRPDRLRLSLTLSPWTRMIPRRSHRRPPSPSPPLTGFAPNSRSYRVSAHPL